MLSGFASKLSRFGARKNKEEYIKDNKIGHILQMDKDE